MPTLVPVEEIETLGAGQIAKRTIQVRFHHHLLPLKLTVLCNDKTIPVKLRPDIGYFVKPLPMDLDTFIIKESRLPGMFEYERRSVTTIVFIIIVPFFFLLPYISRVLNEEQLCGWGKLPHLQVALFLSVLLVYHHKGPRNIFSNILKCSFQVWVFVNLWN